MANRTTRKSVSFSKPFAIRNVDAIQPAGDYIVVADDEVIEGISHLAFRRISTFLHLPSITAPQNFAQLVPIDQVDIDAALMRDRDQTV
jgi:hypothetical protein